MDINNLWSGYDLNSKKQNSRCLSVNTILEGKYLVGPVLGQGGFGITYVGYDLNMESKIAIKEYFPVELVSRDTTTMHGDRVLSLSGEKSVTYKAGLKKYVAEAQNVSKFSEVPGVVSVKDFFYANETAYIVMEYIDGISLKDYLKEKGGRLTEEETLAIMKPILEALVQVHKSGIIHRDISPDNIMLTFEDAKTQSKIHAVKLIDFGAARMTEKNDQKSLTIILKHGYAPEEQYRTHGEQGPWTDVYALCAVLYRMLTGETPVPAMDRMFKDELKTLEQCGAKVSVNTSAAILKGLAVKKDERIQSVQELIGALYEGVKVKASKSSDSAAGFDAKKKTSQLVGIGAAAVAACAIGFAVLSGAGGDASVESVSSQMTERAQTETATQLAENTIVEASAEAQTEAPTEVFVDTSVQEEELGEQIMFFDPQRSASVSDTHVLFCSEDGSVQAIGNNDYGECDVADWDHVAAVIAGKGCSFGIRTDGTVLFAGEEDSYAEEVERWTDIRDVVSLYNGGIVGLKNDGTLCSLVDKEYEMFVSQPVQTACAWTDMKAIVGDGYNIYGLNTDGTILTTNEVWGTEFELGWNDVEYLTMGKIPLYSTALCGLKSDGTADALIFEGEKEYYVEQLHEQEQIGQLVPRIVVHEDGTVDGIQVDEHSKRGTPPEILESWNNIQAAVYRETEDIYYAVTWDGTIVTSVENKNQGNVELEEMKNLQWIRLITSFASEDETENIIGYTKDGKLVSYGSSTKMNEIMFRISGNSAEMEKLYMRMLEQGHESASWTDSSMYKQLCKDAAKMVQFDEKVLVQESGTAYVEEETFTGVKQVLTENGLILLMEDGTVQLADEEIDTRLFKNVEQWANIKEVVDGDGYLIGITTDGKVLTAGRISIQTPDEKMESLYANGNNVLGVSENGTVKILCSEENAVNKGMMQVENWTNIKQLAMGNGHTVGLCEDGTVWATGNNHNGQCDVEDWTNVTYIIAGKNCTLGMTAEGELLVAGVLD